MYCAPFLYSRQWFLVELASTQSLPSCTRIRQEHPRTVGLLVEVQIPMDCEYLTRRVA